MKVHGYSFLSNDVQINIQIKTKIKNRLDFMVIYECLKLELI